MGKRKMLGLIWAGLLTGVLTFSGCALLGGDSSSENSSQGEVSQIEAIYAQYIVYAEAQGQTPMSYEQWLETIKGADGKDGVDGQDGKDGVDGKSAYDIWLANGYSGTQADFLEWLKGEVGAQGEKGDQGEAGVGIESITVNADGDFVVTYTDGTVQIVVIPKEDQHVHTFSDWLTFDENQGLFYHICWECNSVEWVTAQNITTAEELKLAGVNGGVVAVKNDIVLDETIRVEQNLIVNLASTLTTTIDNDAYADGIFHVVSGATLTLNGDGIVDGVTNCNYHMAIWANGGDVVINGGTYTNVGADGDQNDLIYVRNGGTVTINGGSFKCSTPAWTLNNNNNQNRPSTIVIKGGEFFEFDPSADVVMPDGRTHAQDGILVAEGYEVVAETREDGTWYEVVKKTSDNVIDNAEELQLAASNGGEVFIENDLVMDTAVYVTNDITVNLNANISIPNDTVGDGVFCVKQGTLTLNGNGIVDGVGNNGYCMVLWADGGDIVINGGTYTNVGASSAYNYDQFDLIYVKNGGTVTINGGIFMSETPEWTLNCNDRTAASIVITGGSFYKFDPSNLPECVKNDNITVAYGYEVVQDGDWYIVVKEGEDYINPLKTMDITAVQNMNAVLSQEGNVVDVFDVAAVLSKNGFDIENGLIPKLKYHAFYWHKPSNTIVYVNTKDGAFDLVYPEEVVAFSKDTCQYLGTKISVEAAKTPTAPATTTATPVGTTTNMPTDVDTFEELVEWSNQSNGKVESTLPNGTKKTGVVFSGDVKLTADLVLGAKGNNGVSMVYNIIGDTTIDLNGFSITQANASAYQSYTLFVVRSGATLTIIDSSANKTGKIAVGNTAFQIDAGATVNMYSGTITVAADRSANDIAYGASLVWTNGGTFNMYGGTLDVASTNFNDNWAISNSGVANLFAGKVVGYIDESANIYDITK